MSSPKRAAFDIRLIAGMNIEKKKLMPWVFLGTRVIGPFLTKRPIPNEAAIILSKSVAKNALIVIPWLKNIPNQSTILRSTGYGTTKCWTLRTIFCTDYSVSNQQIFVLFVG